MCGMHHLDSEDRLEALILLNLYRYFYLGTLVLYIQYNYTVFADRLDEHPGGFSSRSCKSLSRVRAKWSAAETGLESHAAVSQVVG